MIPMKENIDLHFDMLFFVVSLEPRQHAASSDAAMDALRFALWIHALPRPSQGQ